MLSFRYTARDPGTGESIKADVQAENEQALVQLFEDLSIELHDDGIDEISLGTLAAQTGGKYYAAKKQTHPLTTQA